MKNLSLNLLILTLIIPIGFIFSQSNSSIHKIEPKDLNILMGKWTGSLTYLDYSSGNVYPMPCDIFVKGKRNNRKIIIHYIFPSEPKANNKEHIKISKDGRLINKRRIESKFINAQGLTEIYTENLGKDGNDGKKAMIRTIYKIGDTEFIMRKEVKFEGTNEWIMRNEFKFQKNPN